MSIVFINCLSHVDQLDGSVVCEFSKQPLFEFNKLFTSIVCLKDKRCSCRISLSILTQELIDHKLANRMMLSLVHFAIAWHSIEPIWHCFNSSTELFTIHYTVVS